MATDTSDEVHDFLVIDNKVVMEINSCRQAMYLIVAAHHMFNIEYPQSLKMCFKFLKEYLLAWLQARRQSLTALV